MLPPQTATLLIVCDGRVRSTSQHRLDQLVDQGSALTIAAVRRKEDRSRVVDADPRDPDLRQHVRMDVGVEPDLGSLYVRLASPRSDHDRFVALGLQVLLHRHYVDSPLRLYPTAEGSSARPHWRTHLTTAVALDGSDGGWPDTDLLHRRLAQMLRAADDLEWRLREVADLEQALRYEEVPRVLGGKLLFVHPLTLHEEAGLERRDRLVGGTDPQTGDSDLLRRGPEGCTTNLWALPPWGAVVEEVTARRRCFHPFGARMMTAFITDPRAHTLGYVLAPPSGALSVERGETASSPNVSIGSIDPQSGAPEGRQYLAPGDVERSETEPGDPVECPEIPSPEGVTVRSGCPQKPNGPDPNADDRLPISPRVGLIRTSE